LAYYGLVWKDTHRNAGQRPQPIELGNRLTGPRISIVFHGGHMSSQKSFPSGFLKITGAGVAGTALGATASIYARVMGAGDRAGVAICERVRGPAKITFTGLPVSQEQEIAALCESDESV